MKINTKSQFYYSFNFHNGAYSISIFQRKSIYSPTPHNWARRLKVGIPSHWTPTWPQKSVFWTVFLVFWVFFSTHTSSLKIELRGGNLASHWFFWSAQLILEFLVVEIWHIHLVGVLDVSFVLHRNSRRNFGRKIYNFFKTFHSKLYKLCTDTM